MCKIVLIRCTILSMGNNQKIIGKIGKCIYCGTKSEILSDEHIVPLALGGEWVLKEASCSSCSNITSGIEFDLLRDTFFPVRVRLNLPTRHKKKWPDILSLNITRGGKTETIEMPANQRPTILNFPGFKLPAYLDGRKYEKGIEVTGMYYGLLINESFQQFIKEFNIDGLSETITFNSFKGGFSLARLLAKIAHGFAVAQYGEEIIDSSYVLPALLGKSDDIGKWVGSTDRLPPVTKGLHEISLAHKNGNILAYVRLLANFSGPEYLIVVAPLPSV